MRHPARFALPLLVPLLLAGCTVLGQDPLTGILVTSTTVPYTIDLNNTPVSTDSGRSSIVRIREPFTGVGVYTELNSNALSDIATQNGLERLYFADLKTFSLFSIWRTHTLILYGSKATGTPLPEGQEPDSAMAPVAARPDTLSLPDEG